MPRHRLIDFAPGTDSGSAYRKLDRGDSENERTGQRQRTAPFWPDKSSDNSRSHHARQISRSPFAGSGDPKYGGTWVATLLSALPNSQPTLEILKEAYPDALGAKRHFLVTEVTRMGATTVCVAAIDLQRLTMARLLRGNQSNWSSDLVGGGLRPGSIVRGRISPVQTPRGFPQQTEDTPLAADFERVRSISSAELFYCLAPRADTCVADIFDGHLVRKST